MNKNIFKQIRIDAGISQKEYADMLGLSQPFVSLMENGKYPISDSTKRKIIREFEVTEDIMNQLDKLNKLGKRGEDINFDKVGRIRKMFDEAVATNLAVYVDMGEFETAEYAEDIPEIAIDMIEKEIMSKIDATLYEIIGIAIDDYKKIIAEMYASNI